jgi:hypothetical protein
MMLAAALLPLKLVAETITDVVDWDARPLDFPAEGISSAGERIESASGRRPVACLLEGLRDTAGWVERDFWAEPAPPGTVEPLWRGANTNRWGNTLTPPVQAGPVQPGEPGGSANTDAQSDRVDDSEFLAELASVDWIGVSAYADGANEQLYDLKDVNLMVPEPGQVLLLAAALAVAVLSIRCRRRGPVASPSS